MGSCCGKRDGQMGNASTANLNGNTLGNNDIPKLIDYVNSFFTQRK